MADIEQQTPIEGTPAEDVEMEGGDAGAGAGDEAGLTEMEPEAPKLVLFAELVELPRTCLLQLLESSATAIDLSIEFRGHVLGF